jgi:peptidyl-prolyl cis-trans isomerase D
MITDLMRKHRQLLLWVIMVPIILTFVFWGGGFGKANPDRDVNLASIAVVDGVEIPAPYFREQINRIYSQYRRFQPDLTLASLHEDGTAMEVVEGLVNEQILGMEAQLLDVEFDQDFLAEQMKEQPQFQTDGKFDPELWNRWVEQDRISWRDQYAAVAQELKRRMVLQEITAMARVPESKVREAFEKDNTSLKVRYVAVEPKIEPTEEQLRAHYEENSDQYMTQREVKAQFVSFDFAPPRPDLLDELVQQAREGADFAELAREHSEGPYAEAGGEAGWRTESPAAPDYQQPMFQTPVGEVSEPVKGPGGWYIYKVEEERINEDAGQREVRVRQIYLSPELSEDEKEARLERARAFAEAAQGEGFEAAAEAAGLEVKTTDAFSTRSQAVENVPQADSWAFRTNAASLEAGAISEVITGRENLYIAKGVEVIEPEQQPYEEVADRVRTDAIRSIERSPEHMERIAALSEEIQQKADSIEDILRLYPDAASSPAETEEFSVADYTPGQGPRWRADDVYEAVGWGPAGTFGGPVLGLRGTLYFVELTGKTPPDESAWQEKYEEEAADIRQQLQTQAERQVLNDYFEFARLHHSWRLNEDAYASILDLEKDEPEDLEADPEAAEDVEEGVEEAQTAEEE